MYFPKNLSYTVYIQQQYKSNTTASAVKEEAYLQEEISETKRLLNTTGT